MASPVVIVRLALFGVLCLLAAQAVWLYAMDRSRKAHPWIAAWCSAAAILVICRHFQTHADTAAAANAALIVQLIGGSFLIPITVGWVSWLTDRPPRRWLIIALAVAAAGISVLLAFTDSILAPLQPPAPDLASSNSEWITDAGPLLPPVAVLMLVVAVYCAELLRRYGFRADPVARFALIGGVLFLVVAIANDSLLLLGFDLVTLREFALGTLAIALFLAVSRHGVRELAGTKHSAAVRAETIGVLTRAQEQERRSLAHLLHQSTSQSLTTLVLRLQALDTDASPDEIAEEVQELRALAKATAEEVRGLARSLRPVLVDDLGLQVVLERFAAELATEHDLECDVQVYGVDSSLPEWLGIVLLRTAQDVVATVRQRGRAGSLSIVVDRSSTGVRLIVEQDAALGAGSRDFEILRERTTLYGGDVTVESSESLGTSIYVDFPLNPGDERSDH